MFIYEVFTILPLIYLFLSILFILTIGIILDSNTYAYQNFFGNKEHTLSSFDKNISYKIAIAPIIFTLTEMSLIGVILISTTSIVNTNENLLRILNLPSMYNFSLFYDLCIVDHVADFSIIFLAFVSIAFLQLANMFLPEENDSFEYVIIIIFAILATFILITSNDFLIFYLTIEVISRSSFILMVVATPSLRISVEAGLKYFILGSISSVLLLFGISLIYMVTATTNFFTLHDITYGFSNLELGKYDLSVYVGTIILGLFFILIALIFKFSVTPLQLWLPEIYHAAPTLTTAFFVIIPKIAYFAILFRLIDILTNFANPEFDITTFLLLSSILTFVSSAFPAMNERNLKRLIAFSTINNMAFILILLSLSTNEAFDILLNYLISYRSITITLFSIITNFIRPRFGLENFIAFEQKSDLEIAEITQLATIIKIYPLFGFRTFFILFSFVGMPPLVGFFIKFAAINELRQTPELIFFTIYIRLLSLINIIYYLRLIVLILKDTAQKPYYVFAPYEIPEEYVIVELTPGFLINIL